MIKQNIFPKGSFRFKKSWKRVSFLGYVNKGAMGIKEEQVTKKQSGLLKMRQEI